MRQNKFICFSGTDGTGKSTLALKVFQSLKEKGKRTKLVYGRHRPIVTVILYLIGKRIFLKKADMFSDYDQYLSDKRKIHKKRSKLTKLYFLTILIEYYFQVLFKIILPYKFGYWIVSDRYVYDTVINDIAVDSMLPIEDVRSLIQKFWHLIPKPDFAFLIKIPEQIALNRKRDIPSLTYLKIRNEYYDKLGSNEKMIVLDGRREIAELESVIVATIEGNQFG